MTLSASNDNLFLCLSLYKLLLLVERVVSICTPFLCAYTFFPCSTAKAADPRIMLLMRIIQHVPFHKASLIEHCPKCLLSCCLCLETKSRNVIVSKHESSSITNISVRQGKKMLGTVTKPMTTGSVLTQATQPSHERRACLSTDLASPMVFLFRRK